MLQEYTNEIKYTVSEEETIESIDSIYQGTAYYSTLKFFVRETLADEGCDLGLALQLFLQEYQICCNYHHDDLRKEAFNKMLNTIKSDKRFSETYLDKCHNDNNFLEFSDDGEQESIKIREIGQDKNPGSA